MSTIKTNTIQPTAAGNNLIFANGSAAEAMRITDAGLVGVGTIPSAILHTKASGELLRLETTNASGAGYMSFFGPEGLRGYIGRVSDTDSHFIVENTRAFDLILSTNNIEKMRILSNGLVGIGTVDPQAKLHIVGGQAEALRLTAGTTGDVGLRVYEDADTAGFLRLRPLTSTQKGFVFSNDGDTGILNINTLSSRVGIGTTTPEVALDVAGSIKASTSLILGNANATMAAPNGSAPIFGARAWAYIPKSTVSGTQPASSGNIASITRFVVSGVEKLTKVTFITPMPHANYAVVGMARFADAFNNQPMVLISPGYVSPTAIQPNTTTEMYYTVWDNSTDNIGYNQRADVSLVIYC